MSTSGFSYAQAARGQIVPQTPVSPSSNSSPTTNAISHEKKDESGLTTVLQPAVLQAPPANVDVNKLPTKLQPALSEPDANSVVRKVDSDAASATGSSTLISTLAESTSNLSLEESSPQVLLSDKAGNESAASAHNFSAEDAKANGPKPKPEKGQHKSDEKALSADSRETEKEFPKPELSPAPLPSVNIWDQRKQEFAAKSKAASASIPRVVTPPATSTAALVTGQVNGGAKTREGKKSTALSAGGKFDIESNGGLIQGSKPQAKKSSDGSRANGDQQRRPGPRGSRTIEKDEKATSDRESLPSVHDATLWPTPKLSGVSEDPKLKDATDKAEDSSTKESQEEANNLKSRKKGWRPLDFVPTVNFQTPIPNARGSKPKTSSRGGRESSRGGYVAVTNGGIPHEKTLASTTVSTLPPTSDQHSRSKETGTSATPSRGLPQSSATSKRFLTDPALNREYRKQALTGLPDKIKESVTKHSEISRDSEPISKDSGNSSNTGSAERPGQPYFSHFSQIDRRNAGPAKGIDQIASLGKDSSFHYKESPNAASGDRQEAKSERSVRGGLRGARGGHNNSASQNHHLPHSGAHMPNGHRVVSNTPYKSSAVSSLPPTAAPYNPSSQQISFGNQQNATRLSRNPRIQSGSHTAVLGSRLQAGANTYPRPHGHSSHVVPALPVDYQMQAFSVPPFNSFFDPELLAGLTLQVEYYFSIENLCKDIFLRRKMDGQGFVPLFIVAKFKRMAELAPSLDYIRAACEQSDSLDYIIDSDHNEMIRSRYIWSEFVLPVHERDEEARNPGLDLRSVVFRSLHSRPQQAYFPGMFGAVGYPPPAVFQPMLLANGHDATYSAYDNGAHFDHTPGLNNVVELNGRIRPSESQLSATVPDFSPGELGGAPTTLEDYQNCPDEQVEKLVVLVGSETDSPTVSSEHCAGTAKVDLKGVQTKPQNTNGSVHSPGVNQTVGQEPYPELRARAFAQRKSAKTGESSADTKHLYRFWTHCLPDKFNVRMYEDFRSSALEDVRRNPTNDFGLKCLLQYYSRILTGTTGTKPYPTVFVSHHEEAKRLSASLMPMANGDN